MTTTIAPAADRPAAGTILRVLVALVLATPTTVLAGDPTSVLITQSLPDIQGRVATVLTVQYGPGTASDAHQHPGSVFGYVLEGTMVCQLEGEKAVTYSAGQSWYEPPGQAHVVLRNASREASAKILLFILAQEGEALRSPVTLSDSGK
ncbi:MAG: cupin domain-containing protein [Nitrospira sp.]|nr:cupin domain-containing protein [Nitrospira sp.]